MSAEAYRWPRAAIMADYWRSGPAFSACFVAALLVPPLSIGFAVFATLALVFGLYLGQTVLRARTTATLVPDGLAISGYFGDQIIRWDTLDGFALRYYTLRRDKEAGWLDLKLAGGGAKVTLDDRIDGFRPILERAWDAARERDLGISSATYANLTAAGLLPKSPPPSR
jgi:hypothetical protein